MHFGTKTVTCPDVINKGVKGGYAIYKIDGKAIPAYEDYKKYFVNVIETKNNEETGNM